MWQVTLGKISLLLVNSACSSGCQAGIGLSMSASRDASFNIFFSAQVCGVLFALDLMQNVQVASGSKHS